MTRRDLQLRLRALLRRRVVNRELDDELTFHIDRETAKLVDAGIDPIEARRRARNRFGSGALAAEQCRDERRTGAVDAFGRDLRYAVTQIRRAPLAAATIVGTVALGLALLAVVFAVYNALYLGDPVRNPQELVAVYRPPAPGKTGVWVPFTRPQYAALRGDTTVFSDVLAMMRGVQTRIDGRRMTGSFVTGNFFQVLGIDAALGRTLTPADDVPFAGHAVIVLSHAGWTRLAARDPAIIGRRVRIAGVPHDVVGVTPESFRGLDTTVDFFAPLALSDSVVDGGSSAPAPRLDYVIGRLKPGVPPATATAALTTWVAGRDDIPRVGGAPKTIRLEPVAGNLIGGAFSALLVFAPLFAVFGLILLIGCANVASLLLARGVSRQREIGIRLALGASRSRVVRQLVTESLLLALLAGIAGLVLSRVLIAAAGYALVSAMPGQLAEQFSVTVPALDWRVYLFTSAAALVSTAFFGLGPAFNATRIDLLGTMRGELRRGVRVTRARQALIAVQVCAATLLLVAAVVFLRSAKAAAAEDAGVRTRDTIALRVAHDELRPAVVAAVTSDPSVDAIAASFPAPLDGGINQTRIVDVALAGATSTLGVGAGRLVGYRLISPDYLRLLDIGVVAGRGFRPEEQALTSGVALVSASTARALWPEGNAVGRAIRVGGVSINYGRGDNELLPMPSSDYLVVGVVRDVHPLMQFLPGARLGLTALQGTEIGLYLPVGLARADTTLTVRVRDDPEQARRRLMQALVAVDPAAGDIATLRATAATSAYALSFAFIVMALLGALALVLTVSGLFGVLSYLVEQRRQEIGVRLALGATTARVTRLVLAQSAGPVAMGIALGAGLAFEAARALSWVPVRLFTSSGSSYLPATNMVHAFDPAAYAGGAIVILLACAAAAIIPARRAARVDPVASLRQE